jgi:hypothetical protein
LESPVRGSEAKLINEEAASDDMQAAASDDMQGDSPMKAGTPVDVKD